MNEQIEGKQKWWTLQITDKQLEFLKLMLRCRHEETKNDYVKERCRKMLWCIDHWKKECESVPVKRNVIKSVCRCKEGKQGRTVDENLNQICDVCGGS
jgi:hypothetical protein